MGNLCQREVLRRMGVSSGPAHTLSAQNAPCWPSSLTHRASFARTVPSDRQQTFAGTIAARAYNSRRLAKPAMASRAAMIQKRTTILTSCTPRKTKWLCSGAHASTRRPKQRKLISLVRKRSQSKERELRRCVILSRLDLTAWETGSERVVNSPENLVGFRRNERLSTGVGTWCDSATVCLESKSYGD